MLAVCTLSHTSVPSLVCSLEFPSWLSRVKNKDVHVTANGSTWQLFPGVLAVSPTYSLFPRVLLRVRRGSPLRIHRDYLYYLSALARVKGNLQ